MWRNTFKVECSKFFSFSKQAWKRAMKRMIKQKNTEELLNWSDSYKKISREKYENQELRLDPNFRCLNLQDSRIYFRKTCFLLQTVRLNYKSNKQYKAESYLCPDCLSLDPPISHPDDQASLLTCHGNSDLRVGKNLRNLKEEMEYYRNIISRRTQKYGWHSAYVLFQ